MEARFGYGSAGDRGICVLLLSLCGTAFFFFFKGTKLSLPFLLQDSSLEP